MAEEVKTTEMEEQLKDVTDCSICLEAYTEPRILPCIHTFCLKCLQEAGAKTNKCPEDRMPCPICRKEFTIPENGFSGLQKNFFMDKMVEIRKVLHPTADRILCALCSGDSDPDIASEVPTAEVYCADCRQKLCHDCSSHHKKSKLSKFHKIVALESQVIREDCMGAALPTVCDKHNGKALEIYCSVCKKVVCAICFFEFHKTHEGVHVNTIINDFQDRIQKSAQNFPKFVSDLIKVRETVENDMKAFVQKADLIGIHIAAAREELKQIADEHSTLLLSQLETLKLKGKLASESRNGELEALLTSLRSYETYCKQITTMGSASDVCGAADNLCNRAEELSKMYMHKTQINLQVKEISFRKTTFQEILKPHEKNIIGKIEGNINWDAETTVATYTPMESVCDPKISGYRVNGITVIGNELYIAGNDGVVVINELTTLKFKRRWKIPIAEQLSDIKGCNTKKCLYILCDKPPSEDSKARIARVDPNGKVLLTWSVRSTTGQISVTRESNILLTTSFRKEAYVTSFELCEYALDGKLLKRIPLLWNSGIELASHALKLTSEHFVVCHGNSDSSLVGVCLIDTTGTVLKYYGAKWNKEILVYPVCIDIDCGGNLLILDKSRQQVIVLNSNLEFKRCLVNHATKHPKYEKSAAQTSPMRICLDESVGRIFIVENVFKIQGGTRIQSCDEVTVYTIRRTT